MTKIYAYSVTMADGIATIYNTNLRAAWEQATATFSDVTNVQYAFTL